MPGERKNKMVEPVLNENTVTGFLYPAIHLNQKSQDAKVLSEVNIFQKAYLLSLFTIFYNIVEGLVSMLFGYEDQTLALFGFGVDSFIEVISGIGNAIMILRIKQNPQSSKSEFEIYVIDNKTVRVCCK